MNFENGLPIANVVDSNDNIIKTVYLDDHKNKNNAEEMTLTDLYQFQQIPMNITKENDRDVIYVAGASGSGKSYYIKKYVECYMKQYPKRPLYLFSYLEQDTTLDKIKKIKRIDIFNKEFLETEVKSKDFKNSMVIMDDIEGIPYKAIKNKVMCLINQIISLGRHDNVTLIYACHSVTNGHDTKVILNESNSLTIFVKTLGNAKLKYLLEDYYGFDKEQVEKLRKVSVDSRATTIFRTYPKIVLTERDIYLV